MRSIFMKTPFVSALFGAIAAILLISYLQHLHKGEPNYWANCIGDIFENNP